MCDFFQFHIEIEGKCGWIIWGGGGVQGYVGPPLKLLGDACIIRDIMKKFLLVLSEYMCKISRDSPP